MKRLVAAVVGNFIGNFICLSISHRFFFYSKFLKYGAPPDAIKATARHILVKTQDDASMVLDKLAAGTSTFSELAREYSTCPSGASGGSLGSFEPGTMVPEFDAVIFSPDTVIGTILGPVETKFGYHLIVVDKRSGGGDWY